MRRTIEKKRLEKPEEIKPGMKVYGTLAFQRPGWVKNSITTYHGVITKVTENGFKVKYKGIISELYYDFSQWKRVVFAEKETCEQEADKAVNPGFKKNLGKKRYGNE